MGLLRGRKERKSAVGDGLLAVCGTAKSGKTTLSVALACDRADCGQEAVLLDLDVFGGQVNCLFDYEKGDTLADFMDERVSAEQMAAEDVFRHDGVLVLDSPKTLVHAAGVKLEDLALLEKCFINVFPSVICDLPALSSASAVELFLDTCELSDRIIYVCAQDLPSVISSERILSVVPEEYREKVELTVGRWMEDSTLSDERIEKMLGLEIAHRIPDDREAVEAAINLGCPLCTEDRASKAAKAIRSEFLK